MKQKYKQHYKKNPYEKPQPKPQTGLGNGITLNSLHGYKNKIDPNQNITINKIEIRFANEKQARRFEEIRAAETVYKLIIHNVTVVNPAILHENNNTPFVITDKNIDLNEFIHDLFLPYVGTKRDPNLTDDATYMLLEFTSVYPLFDKNYNFTRLYTNRKKTVFRLSNHIGDLNHVPEHYKSYDIFSFIISNPNSKSNKRIDKEITARGGTRYEPDIQEFYFTCTRGNYLVAKSNIEKMHHQWPLLCKKENGDIAFDICDNFTTLKPNYKFGPGWFIKFITKEKFAGYNADFEF